MATEYNTSKLPAWYPGEFNRRENRLKSFNFSVVALTAGDSYTIKDSDGITHVTMAAASGTTTLILPAVGPNKGRLIVVYVSDSTGTVAIKESDGTTDALVADNAAGHYELFSTGSDWIQVG